MSKKNTVDQNIFNINEKIADLSRELEPQLKSSDVTFSLDDFIDRITDHTQTDLILKSDDQARRVYESAAELFFDEVDGDDIFSLYKARQNFDARVRRQLSDRVFDEARNNAAKNAIQDIRRIANQMIEEATPDTVPYAQTLRRQHLLYEAADNITAKIDKKLVGQSLKERLLKIAKKPASQALLGGIGAGGAFQIFSD